MHYLGFYHCWVKSALIWYIKKKYHTTIQKKKNHDTVINNTEVEAKISKCWDQLHPKIYFMASSEYKEFLPPWNEEGFLSKCSQNLGRELSAQRPEHTPTRATSPTAQVRPEPSHQKFSTHICTISGTPPPEWARSRQSRDRGLLTSNPLEEAGKSPGAQPSPREGSAELPDSHSGTTWCH